MDSKSDNQAAYLIEDGAYAEALVVGKPCITHKSIQQLQKILVGHIYPQHRVQRKYWQLKTDHKVICPRHDSTWRLTIRLIRVQNSSDARQIKEQIARILQVEVAATQHALIYFLCYERRHTSPHCIFLFKDWNKVINNFEALSAMKRLGFTSRSYQKVKFWTKSQVGNTPEVSAGSKEKQQSSSPVPKSEN